jgi:2-deoxy-D-gluconate 3-dehydrogenase
VNPFDLRGRVAVVTGGNGGIGLGMARGLAAAGARIVIAARNVEKSLAAVERLQNDGAAALALPVDVTSEASVAELFAQCVAQCGRVDILVNNAGTNIRRPPQDCSASDWHTVVDTNLTSTFLCSRAAYPHLKQVGGGKIVNVGSMMSVFGAPYASAYAASKGGVVQLTKSMASAWAVDNIQVNAILPGWIDTELTQAARRQVDGLNERVLARTPAGRWGKPDDLAGVAVFLASAASDFITGATLAVDGGFSAQA